MTKEKWEAVAWSGFALLFGFLAAKKVLESSFDSAFAVLVVLTVVMAFRAFKKSRSNA